MADDGPPSNADQNDADAEPKREGVAPGEGTEHEISRLRAFWNNPAYRFVFLFLVYLGIVAAGYPPTRVKFMWAIDLLSEWTAMVEYGFFALFTDSVRLAGKVVVFQGFAVKIIEECTGIYEVLIYSAAVLAFPTTISKRLIGLAMGLPLLYLFNVVRIGVLIVVGRYAPDYFDLMHLYFWQATLILMITSVWLFWIVKVVKNDRTPPVPLPS
jgi:archaeosortase B (VPXXXP-CTERM-specific)